MAMTNKILGQHNEGYPFGAFEGAWLALQFRAAFHVVQIWFEY